MRDQKKAEEKAAERVQLLSPLLTDRLDPAKAKQLRKQICDAAGLSERTIRRYMAEYRRKGFDGLKPRGKERRGTEAIPAHLLEQAILLRREVPTRSIAQIIQILEWETLAKPGELKRSTLQEKLAEKGYSARHMRLYSDTGVAADDFNTKSGISCGNQTLNMVPSSPSARAGKRSKCIWSLFWMMPRALCCTPVFIPPWISGS